MKTEDIKYLIEVLGDWYGVLLTPEQVETIFAGDARFVAEVEQMGVDTSVREWAINLVSNYIGLKDRWPLGMDTASYTAAFFAAFRSLAAEKGIKLRDTWMFPLED